MKNNITVVLILTLAFAGTLFIGALLVRSIKADVAALDWNGFRFAVGLPEQ